MTARVTCDQGLNRGHGEMAAGWPEQSWVYRSYSDGGGRGGAPRCSWRIRKPDCDLSSRHETDSNCVCVSESAKPCWFKGRKRVRMWEEWKTAWWCQRNRRKTESREEDETEETRLWEDVLEGETSSQRKRGFRLISEKPHVKHNDRALKTYLQMSVTFKPSEVAHESLNMFRTHRASRVTVIYVTAKQLRFSSLRARRLFFDTFQKQIVE